MMLFGNSEQAKGYALAQGEINAANTFATVQNFQARLAANRMAATNHALLATAHELRDALVAESQRADFYQNEADKLCNDLMGHKSFTDFFFLLVTGQDPTAEQRFFLDTLLIAIAEHGLTPTAQAARKCAASFTASR